MPQPYKMVLANITTSSLLLILILFYRYIYPKRRINLFALTILISLLPIISILRIGDYESGDFNTHVYRSMSFYNALLDGQFMPSWASELNANYGYPLFIFLNPLLYYLVSLFHFIGFTFISSMKILLAISFVFSGVFMYLFTKSIFKNDLAAFTTSVFYLFTPYHLLDLHFRVAVGETLFFTLLPLFMFFIHRLINNYSFKNTLTVGLITGLLFFTHQAMALFSIIIGGLYLFFLVFLDKTEKPKRLIFATASLSIGFIISMYVWLPHLIYPKYTYAHLLSSQVVSFPNFLELFYSPWRFGFLFQGPKGEHAYLIGYAQLFIILATLILILKEKTISKIKIHQFFWFFCFSVFFFMLTPFSKFIWETLPILNTVQFATRLLLPLAFIIAILAGYFALYYKNKSLIINFLVILTIGYTILNWGHRRLIPEISDTTLKNNLPKATAEGEAFCCMGSPRWVDIKNPWMENAPLKPIEIVRGEGNVTSLFRNSVRHEYAISANTSLLVKENTLYFPGWRVLANGQEVSIDYENPEFKGIINFSIPKGLSYIKVEYHDLPILTLSKFVSFIGFTVVSVYLVILAIKQLAGK